MNMNFPPSKFLLNLLFCASLLTAWRSAQAASLTPVATDPLTGGPSVPAAIGGRINLALATNGAAAFASSSLGAGFLPSRVNDGVTDNTGNSWIAATVNTNEYVAIAFSNAITLAAVVWEGQIGYNGRSSGT